ncbi:helix-turn-helix domain-containing protein [Ammoniphilus sp. CFH 90114]|uniref:helix-turn-helix domain-containing protein n=1 Tax=Ammoniphilus sp. CFH 90114 TaxID=2493665 RepID=UPI00100FC19B|nr:helix-turn-helix transcriptional regulator [Ammoniphilus sp. CFH 90114]RXT14859.1 XRE family transcriptional regulator [Ammoniphilus sp. CFH 90114]
MNSLQHYRMRKGLTTTQLGLMIGMHPANISLVEHGHRKAWPNLRQKLLEVLDTTEDELFNEAGFVKQL